MTAIRYVEGDATRPQADGPAIIAHICNDAGGWGLGFVLAVSRRWPEPERAYRWWYQGRAGNDFRLGAVQVVPVAPNLWVANMVGQHGTRRTEAGPPIRYDAVFECLAWLAAKATAKGASVHMPRIGCGLAGGTWDRIEPLIEQTLTVAGVPTTVYDLPVRR